MLNIVSWNVNGLRAIMKKDFKKNISELDPDILCLQETKAQAEEVKNIAGLLNSFDGAYANSAKNKKGYSGTAMFFKQNPANVTYDIGIGDHDQEGRVITAEYDQFYLVTVYVPNSGRGLPRLDYRGTWDKDFRRYLKELDSKKPVIACGDLNVAHTEIDLANPKSNYNKTAGFTQQEMDGFSALLEEGFVDTWRYFHPDEVAYTYWSYMFNARKNNKGWRIDYFLVSERILEKVQSVEILGDYYGSDHCPIMLKVDL